MQSGLWSAGWHKKRAIYPAIGAIILLTAVMFVAPDVNLLYQIQFEGLDINHQSQLRIPFQNYIQGFIVYIVLFSTMVALIGLAIFIRIAQRHYNSNRVTYH